MVSTTHSRSRRRAMKTHVPEINDSPSSQNTPANCNRHNCDDHPPIQSHSSPASDLIHRPRKTTPDPLSTIPLSIPHLQSPSRQRTPEPQRTRTAPDEIKAKILARQNLLVRTGPHKLIDLPIPGLIRGKRPAQYLLVCVTEARRAFHGVEVLS